MQNMVQESFNQLCEKLNNKGLETRWYKIPSTFGYSALTEQYHSDEIYCLETYLGQSQLKGYETYGVVQVFLSNYLSLSVMMVIERSSSDHSIAKHQPIFNKVNDKNLSTIFLPLLFTAFNELNSADEKCGIIVQLYNTKISPSNLFNSSIYTVKLLTQFKKKGQLALIAVDFDDSLMRFVARIARPIATLIAGDVHMIPSTSQQSMNKIPLDDGKGGYFIYDQNSTAFDKALKLAISYLK